MILDKLKALRAALKSRLARLKLHWNVARRKYTVWLAVAAAFLPSVLQWAGDNIDLLGLFLKLDSTSRETLRLVLVALIPIASALPQKSVAEARAALEAAQASERVGAAA